MLMLCHICIELVVDIFCRMPPMSHHSPHVQTKFPGMGEPQGIPVIGGLKPQPIPSLANLKMQHRFSSHNDAAGIIASREHAAKPQHIDQPGIPPHEMLNINAHRHLPGFSPATFPISHQPHGINTFLDRQPFSRDRPSGDPFIRRPF